MAIFVIFELNHKTRHWVAIEYSDREIEVILRLQALRTTNGDKADYRVEFVPEIPV